MSKDILVIINYPLADQIKKGNIVVLQVLFDSLSEVFDAVHVMSLKDSNPASFYDFGKKVKVYPVPPVVEKPRVLRYALSLRRELAVARKIIKENPVVVVRALALLTSGYIATKVAKEAGIPCIVSLHEDRRFNEREQGGGSLLSPLFEFFERRVARSVSLMPVINNFIKRRALELGVAEDKITIHWNFAGEKFSPGKIPVKPRFLFVGRLEPVKRLDIILDAFALVKESLPDVRLVVAGDGGMRSDWEKLSADLNVNVEFLGNVAHDKLPDIMRSCSALVIVTGGFTIIESLACGLPVVAAKAEWADEVVIDGRTGFLVDSRNPADFASAISKLAKSNLHEMSKNCRKVAEEKFSVVKYKVREKGFYNKLGIF